MTTGKNIFQKTRDLIENPPSYADYRKAMLFICTIADQTHQTKEFEPMEAKFAHYPNEQTLLQDIMIYNHLLKTVATEQKMEWLKNPSEEKYKALTKQKFALREALKVGMGEWLQGWEVMEDRAVKTCRNEADAQDIHAAFAAVLIATDGILKGFKLDERRQRQKYAGIAEDKKTVVLTRPAYDTYIAPHMGQTP